MVIKNLKYKEYIMNIISKKINGKIVAVALSTVLTLIGAFSVLPNNSYASELGNNSNDSIKVGDDHACGNPDPANGHLCAGVTTGKPGEGYNVNYSKYAGNPVYITFQLEVHYGPVYDGKGVDAQAGHYYDDNFWTGWYTTVGTRGRIEQAGGKVYFTHYFIAP
jgi:hypothetical protein